MSTKKKIADDRSLQRAIECLQIKDVSFEKFNCELLNDFDPHFDDRAEELSYQTRVHVSKFEIIQIEYYESEEGMEAEDLKVEHTLKVSVEFGVRLGEKGKLSKKDSDPEVLALLEGTMIGYYTVLNDSILTDDNALDEFTSKNAPFHMWPYWREFVSSSLARANLKKISLPYMKFPSKKRQRVKTPDS